MRDTPFVGMIVTRCALRCQRARSAALYGCFATVAKAGAACAGSAAPNAAQPKTVKAMRRDGNIDGSPSRDCCYAAPTAASR